MVSSSALTLSLRLLSRRASQGGAFSCFFLFWCCGFMREWLLPGYSGGAARAAGLCVSAKRGLEIWGQYAALVDVRACRGST